MPKLLVGLAPLGKDGTAFENSPGPPPVPVRQGPSNGGGSLAEKAGGNPNPKNGGQPGERSRDA